MTNNGISATVQLLQDFKDDEALGIPPPHTNTHTDETLYKPLSLFQAATNRYEVLLALIYLITIDKTSTAQMTIKYVNKMASIKYLLQ
jgi:hypothetical protein